MDADFILKENDINIIKIQANEHFNKEEYYDAIKLYTDCIAQIEQHNINDRKCTDMSSILATLYSNRAACYLNIKNYDEAIKDCNQALDKDVNNKKAMYRKCISLKNLERYDDAFVLAEYLFHTNPKSTLYTDLMHSLTQKLFQSKNKESSPLFIAQQLYTSINNNGSSSSSVMDDENGKKLYSLCCDKNAHNRIFHQLDNDDGFNLLENLNMWLNMEIYSVDFIDLAINCLLKIALNSHSAFITICNKYLTPSYLQALLKYIQFGGSNDKIYITLFKCMYNIILRATSNDLLDTDIFGDYLDLWMFNECMCRTDFSIKLAKYFSSCTIKIVKQCNNCEYILEEMSRKNFHLVYTRFTIDFIDRILSVDNNTHHSYDDYDILVILESNALILATFNHMFDSSPVDRRSIFVDNLKTELNFMITPLRVIIGRFIILKSIPALYQDFYIDDGPFLLKNINSYLVGNRSLVEESNFTIVIHVIMDNIIAIVGMKRLFLSIVELPEFKQVYTELIVLFDSNKSLAKLLQLRVLIALVKLDIAKWQYSDQKIDISSLKQYYNDLIECSDFLQTIKLENLDKSPIDFDTLSNVVELVAYISLQPDFKELIVNDNDMIKKLVIISKLCATSSLSSDPIDSQYYLRLQCSFFILKIVQNLINAIFTTKNDSDEGELSKEDLKKLAKTTGKDLPKKHMFDKKKYVNKRIEIISNQSHIFNLIFNVHDTIKSITLAFNSNKDDKTVSNTSNIYPMMAKILQVLMSNQNSRGIAVQCGMVPILLFIFSKYSSNTGTINRRNDEQQLSHLTTLYAASALSRIIITNNPTFVFKRDTIYESIRPFLYLVKNRSVDHSNEGGLVCFEGLLALTNILSVGDHVRKHFASITYSYHTLETVMFDGNEKIVTSAIECASNLFICPEIINKYFLPSPQNEDISEENREIAEEKLKKFIIFANETESIGIATAASSALIHLSQYRAITIYFMKLNSFLPLLDTLLNSSVSELMYRASVIIFIVLNVLTIDEINNYGIVGSPLFETVLKMEKCEDTLIANIPNIENFIIYLHKIIDFAFNKNLIKPF